VGTFGISKVGYPAYLSCLKESEADLVKIGRTKCNRLRDQSQLSAVICLLIRATSLFRSALSLVKNGQLDACDAVRRAYLETWLLAFEFRLEGSQEKTARWHNGKDKSWSANVSRLAKFLKSQGIESMLGRDYGGLSNMAHPTKNAALTSVVLVTAPLGGCTSVERATLVQARTSLESEDIPMMMYRLLWLIIEERTGLIPIEAELSALPMSVSYVNEYAKSGRINAT